VARRSRRLNGGRSLDRLINFTDAVVAVAVTLLALPLVDIAAPSGDQTVWNVLNEHSSDIIAFLFTFYVVVVMWLAHNRILNDIVKYDQALLWLNTLWLVGIVLLPWFSAMFGQSDGGTSHPSVGVLYWLILAAIALTGSAMSFHLHRHPDLLPVGRPQSTTPAQDRAVLRGPIIGAYFLLIAIAWVVLPDMAPWLAFGIIPLSIWLRPAAQGDDDDDHASAETGPQVP
jgi:uncharacterized membrane protein